MPFYKKKPVVIEARQFKEVSDGSVIAEWCGGTNNDSPNQIDIKTIEGVMTASLGDYIIKGVKGEFYPCQADIFEETYDKTIPLFDEPAIRSAMHIEVLGGDDRTPDYSYPIEIQEKTNE